MTSLSRALIWFAISVSVAVTQFSFWEAGMTDVGRVVTAKLPDDLVSRMDEVAGRIDRSKSWIVRQAVAEWLAEEQRRHELTLEALKAVDEGRTIPHEEVLARVEQRKRR